MACSSKCLHSPLQPLPALQVGPRQGVMMAMRLLMYVYIASEVFERVRITANTFYFNSHQTLGTIQIWREREILCGGPLTSIGR